MNIDKAKYSINAHFVKLSLYTMKKNAVSSGSEQRLITYSTYLNRVIKNNMTLYTRCKKKKKKKIGNTYEDNVSSCSFYNIT